MTRQKYNELYNLAVLIKNHKNIVSQYVNDNLLHFLDYSKFHLMKEMRGRFKNAVPSSFDAQLYTQVLTCYQNKFDKIQRKLIFETITFKGFDLYKRNTKNNKKGGLKEVIIERKQTPLSSCLTYLVRYGSDDTIEYINNNIGSCDEKKRKYYDNILRCCEKYGFDKLYKLALSKRQRIIKKYSEHPIEFKSLSFSGRSRKTNIIDYNHKFGSKINSFISLSSIGRKTFNIPVRFNKDWYGNIKDYRKGNPDYEYTITFDERKHQVNIHLYKDSEIYIPQANGNVIGIDVNCKHNLFSLSDGTSYDYDRKLVNDFCKLSIEIDNLKKRNKGYEVGKRRQRKLDKLKSNMIKSEQQLIANMCKTLQSQGVGHIVMEDLDNSFGKCYISDKDNSDINYNRKIKFLGLSSLKQEIEHIARKYNIAVSTVHTSYTSKMCSICGCIDDGNRPNQETFECVECGHKDNADFNAAKNIRNRVFVTVLRNALLKQLDNGTYETRNLKREKVKEVLLSFRRNLQETVSSECIEGSLTTFGYV